MVEPDVAHHHADVSGGWLRAGVFGAMDGLVTNIALVSGVGGGGADRHTIILTGLAGLVAGAFSMALGEFASVDTQNDAVAHEVRVEREEITRHPEGEMAELTDMYVEMGLTRPTAEAVAREVHADPELAVKVHITQELGLDPDDQPSPWTAAVSSFVAFSLGGILPLITYLLGSSSLPAALSVGAVGLFAAGAITSRFTTRAWWRRACGSCCSAQSRRERPIWSAWRSVSRDTLCTDYLRKEQTMWEHEHTAETTAVPAAVWAVLSDLDHWAEWDTSMEWVRLDGPLEPGTSVVMKPIGQEPITSTITAVDPNVRYADETVFGEVTLRFSHTLHPTADGGTRVVHRLEVDGPDAAAVGGMVCEDFPDAMAGLLAAARR